MYFKRLEMHGFKSFAEPVVIEFHEGVTCIVGPNGSGKSNISDAIRWVLGEQSPKALRGGKMEEVIFAGTASRKSRGMAEVTLVIDNSSGFLDIDYNEVAITRRMFRSGESEYLINNNQCRLRDIRELIMDTGIGVDGYSIIGQGKIADIVSNKPESRREIFEEAAGVVLYKNKKAEAEKKLASTNNSLERVADILSEIEDRIDGLREDSIKAKEYLELKEKYQDLEINIILKNIENLSSRNQIYKQDILQAEKDIADILSQKEKSDIEFAEKTEENTRLEQIGNEARDSLLKAVEEINLIQNRKELNQEKLSGIDKDDIRLSGEIELLEEKLTKELNNRTELEKSQQEIFLKHKEADEELKSKIVKHSELTADASVVAEHIDERRERLFQLHSLISSKKSVAKSYESIKKALEKRQEQLSEEAVGAKKNNEESNEELKKAQEKRDTLKNSLNELTEDISELQGEKNELIERQKALRIEIEDIKLLGGQKVARKKTIEEMENNYEGYNFAVKHIMHANLPGIKGVVANLMNVPDGLETAIETALGGQMQNIVCDTDSNAKHAVNVLKESKAGRLTFLPISSVKAKPVNVDSRISSAGGFKGLGVDCITFKPEYRNIFEYLLGRVAIVDNMDTAVSLSKIGGGIRFVTLDGEVITGSGAITGGRYKNKTANLLERKGEIQKLDKEIKGLRQSLVEKTKEQTDITERFEDIKEIEESTAKDKHEKEVFLASLESTISALEITLAEIKNSSEKYDREVASIAKEMADADNMIRTALTEISEFENEIVTVQDNIETIMSEYESKKAVIEEAAEQITKSRIAVKDWENKKENLNELIRRISETADDYAVQIKMKKEEKENLEKERNKIFFGSTDDEVSVDDLLKKKENTEDYIKQISGKREALSERLNQLNAELQNAGDKVNAFQDQKYQMEIKSAKIDTQIDAHKERLWDEFEISYAQAMDFKKEDFVMATSVKESRQIKNRIREIGEVNVGAIKEYEAVSERYNFLTAQRTDILTAMGELKKIIQDMDVTIKRRFKENFDEVVKNFENIFKELFGGGYAELRLEDENNPLESGIDIIAQPPGKKLQNINLMSGGEKTMTAIALMFAVLKTKPTPFCILDEVEAALDDANIDRFANYLRNFDDIQFALVTHQKATMEHADVLYGVTMAEHGVSKVLSLRLGDDFEL